MSKSFAILFICFIGLVQSLPSFIPKGKLKKQIYQLTKTDNIISEHHSKYLDELTLFKTW